MSFLSTLFCCFDAEDPARRENNITKTRPRLTKTQSNLQKALTHTTTNNSIRNTSDSTKHLTSVPKNTSFTSAASAAAPREAANSRNIDTNSKKNNSTAADSNKTYKCSNNKDMSNNKEISHYNSTDYKEMVTEITDLKDSTDSSKDDDDAIQVHENQSQGTDDSQINIEGSKNGTNKDEVNKFDALNPISNLNETDESNLNNVVSTLTNEENLFDGQFGVDLTEILPDQTVSEDTGWLLNKQPKKFKGKKCLVLDLDETLVHSSFKFVRQCDFVIPVEIENQVHNVYVIKRPGVDKFLKKVGELFEVVVFTASVSRYGDPLLDILDTHKSIHHRLFRDSCYNYQGNYIKNLSQMGRPLEDLIIIDNSPASYVFHPQHAVPISSWFSDSHDCELTDLLPFLEDLASTDVDDIRLVLDINL